MDYDENNKNYIGQDNNISSNCHTTVSSITSIHIKTEDSLVEEDIALPIIKEEEDEYEDHHVDHSYINDGSPLKFSPAPRTSQSVGTLQEIKVRPQFIKEELSTEEEPRIKTEGGLGNATKTTRFKCNICNSQFKNKYVFKTHREVCHVRISHTVKETRNKYKSMKHSAKFVKNLIECVRKNPCLYNDDHENYNNTDLKSMIWSNIASECDLRNGSIAKHEWNFLRNMFIKSLTCTSRKNSPIGQYAKHMEFIMPYITDEDVEMNMHKEKTTTNVTEEPTNSTAEVIEEEANYQNDIQQQMPRLKRISTSQQEIHPTSKRKRDEETQQPSTSQSQPLDMFFLSMCATTKNLPEYVQLQVKKKIFQAVIEAEEIVAAMHNDQEKNNLLNNEYESNMSPFSVRSNVNEAWDDD